MLILLIPGLPRISTQTNVPEAGVGLGGACGGRWWSAETPLRPQRAVCAGEVFSPSVPQCQPDNLRGLQHGASEALPFVRQSEIPPWRPVSPLPCRCRNTCQAWDVLEAGRPDGELAAPSPLGAEAPLICIP